MKRTSPLMLSLAILGGSCRKPPAVPTTPSPSATCPAEMVHVAAGSFVMGDGNQRPQHEVTLSGYCIDKTEVTVAAYSRCLDAANCSAAGSDNGCNSGHADRSSHPINCVDWNQATAYCAWAHKRLPTEAEWEYAARGADGRAFPWGNDEPTPKRMSWNLNPGDTTPVGSFADGASPFGALDMAGNVWEWVADWYGEYPASAQTNPKGATSGAMRVDRGGGWFEHDADRVRSTYRVGDAPVNRNPHLGFRCASSM